MSLFSVQTAASHWPEWIVAVPLLVFIALSVDDKPSLSHTDWFIISSFFVCILSGFLLQTTSNVLLSKVLLTISLVSCTPCLLMIQQTQSKLMSVMKRSTENQFRRGFYERKILLASRKATLCLGLGLMLPAFGLIYILALSRVFSPETTWVAFNGLSAFTKLVFSSLCMDSHLEISHPAIGLIDAENFSSTSRRAFLRYVFHEVRVPLNSLSLGIQILADREDANPDDQETINMMRDAATFMGEVLNDVMALQRIEEGSLELIKKPFSLAELFQTIEDSFLDMAAEQGIHMHCYITDGVPEYLIGDKFRIGHVLANLVSNAIKFSFPNGTVSLTATTVMDSSEKFGLDNMDNAWIKFSVHDEGRGISEEDQSDDIFQPFRNLNHGEMKKGRGSGLGLAICRELVHMHGGKIYYTSKLNVGSTFHVVVPLEIYTGPISVLLKSHRRDDSRKHHPYEPGSHLSILNSQVAPSDRESLMSRSSSNFTDNAVLIQHSESNSAGLGGIIEMDESLRSSPLGSETIEVVPFENSSKNSWDSTKASHLPTASGFMEEDDEKSEKSLLRATISPEARTPSLSERHAIRVRSPRHSFSAQRGVSIGRPPSGQSMPYDASETSPNLNREPSRHGIASLTTQLELSEQRPSGSPSLPPTAIEQQTGLPSSLIPPAISISKYSSINTLIVDGKFSLSPRLSFSLSLCVSADFY